MRRPKWTPHLLAILAAMALLLSTTNTAWAGNGIGDLPSITADDPGVTHETHECAGQVLIVKRFRDNVLVNTDKMASAACVVVAGVQTPPAETGWVPVIVEVVPNLVPRVRQLPSTATDP